VDAPYQFCVSAPDLSRSVRRPIVEDYARPKAIPSMIDSNFRADSLSAMSGTNPTTRRGSNPARSSTIWMANQQRAEIFALPVKFTFASLREIFCFSCRCSAGLAKE
jgi:hypothetical protein